MRQVASSANEDEARLFAVVLCARGFDVEVSRGRDGSWAGWVLREEQVDAAREAWSAFQANPNAAEFLSAKGALRRKENDEVAESRRSRHEVIDVRRRWR